MHIIPSNKLNIKRRALEARLDKKHQVDVSMTNKSKQKATLKQREALHEKKTAKQ